MKPGGLSLQQDQTEYVKARCEPTTMPRTRARQEGTPCTTREIRELRSTTGSLHWVTGGTRSRRVIRDQSLAEGTISAPVSDHKRAVRTIKRLRCQPEIGLRFRPLSTKMCVLVYADSALHNADANTDDGGSDDEWLAKAKQKGYPCSISTWGLGMWSESKRSRIPNIFHDLEEQSVETNHPVYFRGRGECLSGRP